MQFYLNLTTRHPFLLILTTKLLKPKYTQAVQRLGPRVILKM